MNSIGLFEGTIPKLKRALDLRSLKHSSIVSNIANIDTPNYKAFELIIKEELEKRAGPGKSNNISITQHGHQPGRRSNAYSLRTRPSSTSQFSLRRDGNTVDIDKEMSNLAKNNLLYNTTAKILYKKFQGIRNVIQGGKS